MALRACLFASFSLGLSKVHVVIQCCFREDQTPRRFIFRTGAWQVSIFIHEAWVTKPTDDTWSVSSGDDSQWKHTLCVVNTYRELLQRPQMGPGKMR